MRKYTTAFFIERARQVHGNLYDYTKVEYKMANFAVCIVDKEFGEFFITPHHHLLGRGHVKRNKVRKWTLKSFIEDARNIHGNRYDYSTVEYVSCAKPVRIIDTETGMAFYQNPRDHLIWRGKFIIKPEK